MTCISAALLPRRVWYNSLNYQFGDFKLPWILLKKELKYKHAIFKYMSISGIRNISQQNFQLCILAMTFLTIIDIWLYQVHTLSMCTNDIIMILLVAKWINICIFLIVTISIFQRFDIKFKMNITMNVTTKLKQGAHMCWCPHGKESVVSTSVRVSRLLLLHSPVLNLAPLAPFLRFLLSTERVRS